MTQPVGAHSGAKYLRLIYPAHGDGAPIEVDVYCVLEAFDRRCPAVAHALKKLLAAGLRGKGDVLADLRESRDAIERAIVLQTQRGQRSVLPPPRDGRKSTSWDRL